MGRVALEIPLALLPLRGGAQGNHPTVAGVQGLRDPLDGASFTGGIPAFKEDHDLQPLVADPLLKPYQLHVEPLHLPFIDLLGQLAVLLKLCLSLPHAVHPFGG